MIAYRPTGIFIPARSSAGMAKLVLGRQRRRRGSSSCWRSSARTPVMLAAQDAIARVAADHQRRVDLAVGDRAARVADERLLQHAHRREQRHGAIGADRARDLAAGILVTPAALGHADASDAREQGAAGPGNASAPALRTAASMRSSGSNARAGSSSRCVATPMPTRTGVLTSRPPCNSEVGQAPDGPRRGQSFGDACCAPPSPSARPPLSFPLDLPPGDVGDHARTPRRHRAAPASADVPVSARLAMPCMMAASRNMLNTTQNSQSCGIDALASRARAIALDVLALGRNAQRREVLAGHAAELLLRQPPHHHVIREVGERMAERGELPVEHRDDPRLRRDGRSGCRGGSRRARSSSRRRR